MDPRQLLPNLPDAVTASHAGGVRVAVGFSGGLDSTVLLHALVQLATERGWQLRTIHVHHGLQAQADAWTAHCEDICAQWEVPLTVLHADVRNDQGDGPEAAARKARHAAFAQALQPGEILALAHHRDDQAETFLLRALRGSGTEGLGAMRAWRAFAPGWLWRPLLAHSRATLETCARENGLAWIEDPSNADPDLDRNFLRHRVLPVLRERWPQAAAAFAASARVCETDDVLLAIDDARWLASVRTADPQVLSRPALRTLPAARRARVLRRWIGELRLPPLPANGVQRIEREVLDARWDASARFQWHGTCVEAWGELLRAAPVRARLPADWEAHWTGAAGLPLPGGGRLQLQGAPSFTVPVRVHARRGGERIRLPGRTHSHELKHVLQDLRVPSWERARLPLVSDADGQLLAAGDLVLSADFDAWLRENSARMAWHPD